MTRWTWWCWAHTTGEGSARACTARSCSRAYDAKTEVYETVCNIGTGFSEQALEEFHAELAALVIDKPKPFYRHSSVTKDQPDVWFEPRRGVGGEDGGSDAESAVRGGQGPDRAGRRACRAAGFRGS